MPKLRVGTDCSGIEAPIEALKQLKIPFEHVFSSEIDKYCIQSIKANYNPRIIFGDKDGPYPEGDITKRDITLVPDIDLYVCGFPCQPFSHSGKKEGFEDERGIVFWSCLEVIKVKQPKYFILENVRGILTHDKENKKDKYGRTWITIWNSLLELKELGYTVKWSILNTKDYGIPQNRERVYIIGNKNGDFEWPNKVKMDDLLNYIDWEDNQANITSERNEKTLLRQPLNAIFIDFAVSFYQRIFSNSDLFCGCITTASRLWCVPKHRYANCKELLSLQGFNSLVQVISKSQFKKQIGNSMSVNVLKCILKDSLKLTE